MRRDGRHLRVPAPSRDDGIMDKLPPSTPDTPAPHTPPADTAAAVARRLLRGQATAVLSTSRAGDGWPYGSLVLVATDSDGAPLLLLSTLAEHTRNIKREARVSLLFDGTAGLADRLTGARLSLLGRLTPSDQERHRRRFLSRHASAAGYADFADFAFYHLTIARGHLVAGFGRIQWTEADDLLIPAPPALTAAESEIVRHMNQDHAETLGLYATRLLGLAPAGWRMTGIDAAGLDLGADGNSARLEFDRPVDDAEAARAALVGLAARARA